MRVNCFFDDDPKIEWGNEESGEELKMQLNPSDYGYFWNHLAPVLYTVGL